jgi:hypothetical protein
MRLLAVALILPAMIVLAIAAFETRIFYPPPSHAPTKGIVWHGHTFAARGDFARWLRSRGVRYGVWARRHPSLVGVAANRRTHPSAQQRAEAKRARQKGSDWSLENLGGGAAVLASLGLGIVLVRRRRPGSGGGSEAQIQLAARRAVPAAKRGARLTLRWAKTTTLLSSRMAKSSARTSRRRGNEFARSVARRAAPAAKRGARLTLRLAKATTLLSSSFAASSANRIRRRRGELAWYLATGLLAAGLGLVVTAWLNGV